MPKYKIVVKNSFSGTIDADQVTVSESCVKLKKDKETILAMPLERLIYLRKVGVVDEDDSSGRGSKRLSFG